MYLEDYTADWRRLSTSAFRRSAVSSAAILPSKVRRPTLQHCRGMIYNTRTAALGPSIGKEGCYIACSASSSGLAKEVATEGIRVNAVRPGVIYTEIHASGGEPQRVDRVKASVPMQRGGEVEEVAHAIIWLLSDEASYITGACLDVAGGR